MGAGRDINKRKNRKRSRKGGIKEKKQKYLGDVVSDSGIERTFWMHPQVTTHHDECDCRVECITIEDITHTSI